MTKSDEVTLQLLAALQRQRSSDNILVQGVSVPEDVNAFKGVPSLKKGTYWDFTPMLRARFSFASTWTNAAAAQRWLSLSEMESAREKDSILQQIEVRKRYWTKCMLNRAALDRLSLFGVDDVEKEETYLLWGGQVEPRVLQYVGHDEKEFEDLNEYLEFLTEQDSEQDATG